MSHDGIRARVCLARRGRQHAGRGSSKSGYSNLARPRPILGMVSGPRSRVVGGVPGWGWQAADGIITFVLGLLVLAQWPASGLWVIGLFIGIDLIFYGGAWIALALGLRPG